MEENAVSPFKNFPTFFEEDFWEEDSGKQPGLSVYEDPSHVYVEADLPGLKPEDIEITFEKGVLWVQGERKEEDKQKRYYRKASSSFSYQVLVPGVIDEAQEPEAIYRDGVMKISFTKSQKNQPRRIQIKRP